VHLEKKEQEGIHGPDGPYRDGGLCGQPGGDIFQIISVPVLKTRVTYSL